MVSATQVTLSNAATATSTGVTLTMAARWCGIKAKSLAWLFTLGNGSGGAALITSVPLVGIGDGVSSTPTATLDIARSGTSSASFKLRTASWANFQILASGTSPGDVTIGSLDGVAMRFGTNGPIIALAIDASQNVIAGPGAKATPAELATNATGGFFYIPTMNGSPSGTPAALPTGAAPMVVDRTGNKLWLYVGGAWKGVAIA